MADKVKAAFRRLRKWWVCRRYGICPVHGTLRPHGGYHEDEYGACGTCIAENLGKSRDRDLRQETRRQLALERLNYEWRLPR